jgi:large subunit ribosomal protein L25
MRNWPPLKEQIPDKYDRKRRRENRKTSCGGRCSSKLSALRRQQLARSQPSLPSSLFVNGQATSSTVPILDSEVATNEADQADPTTSSTLDEPESASAALKSFPPNPFLPLKNFVTGRWRGPKFGLRQQADLVKLAKMHGLEELLPPGRKSTAFKEQRLIERGLRIKGTGEGQRVKGHKWERRMEMTLDKRRTAMENMPALIREWKQKGHGRGWTKYPSSKAKKR